MKLKDHLARIQQKPQHQRERIAVIATAVSFSVVLVIWFLTFSEMNRSTQPEMDSSAIEQLGDLKSSAGEGKKSIEEMWGQMPNQEDMIDAERQIIPPEYGTNDSGINQDLQDDGNGAGEESSSDETVPANGNKDGGNEIPLLP
jgi:hypothetical protein